MNNAVLAALATVVGSALSLYVGHFLGNRNRLDADCKDISRNLLLNVFEPLMISIDNNTFDISLASRLFEENYSAIPIFLMGEYADVMHGKPVDEFKIMLRSYFNATRKQLGYPFDFTKIELNHFPPPIRLSRNFAWAAYISSLICIFFGTLFYYLSYPQICAMFFVLSAISAFMASSLLHQANRIKSQYYPWDYYKM